VKSAYYIAMRVVEVNGNGESTAKHNQAPFWKRIWQLNVPPKVQIFVWQACRNGLPTMLNLRCKGLISSGFCLLYDKEIDLSNMLFSFVPIPSILGLLGLTTQ